MAHIFNRIIDEGYWVSFGSLTPSQQACKDTTCDAIDDLFAVRQREKYVHEVKACICGYPPADETEPMVPENFSQYQFYLPIEQEIIAYVDRFDYLICCVANGICKVHKGFEERYDRALLNVLTFRTAQPPMVPERVLDEELMKAPGPVYSEQNRSMDQQVMEVITYLAKKDAYSKSIRDELAQLEAEEAAAEHRRREAADRAAGHNPYKVTADEASTVADEMTAADDVEALQNAAKQNSVLAQGGVITLGRSNKPIPDAEDPTPVLSLVLAVKAEEEARAELERRRYERRNRLQEEKEAELKAAQAKAAAEEAARAKAAAEEIARLQAERLALEKEAAETAKVLEEAARLRDLERSRMAAMLAQQSAAEDVRRLEEANERERVARELAEKAAKRAQEAADREAIAREAAARENRRLQLLAGREVLMREEKAMQIVNQSRNASLTPSAAAADGEENAAAAP